MDKKYQGFCIVQRLVNRKSSYILNTIFLTVFARKSWSYQFPNYEKVHKIRFGKFTWSEFVIRLISVFLLLQIFGMIQKICIKHLIQMLNSFRFRIFPKIFISLSKNNLQLRVIVMIKLLLLQVFDLKTIKNEFDENGISSVHKSKQLYLLVYFE